MLPSLTNGSMTISTNGTTTHASFECNVGYTIKGAVRSVCQTNGNWDVAIPICGNNLNTKWYKTKNDKEIRICIIIIDDSTYVEHIAEILSCIITNCEVSISCVFFCFFFLFNKISK